MAESFNRLIEDSASQMDLLAPGKNVQEGSGQIDMMT